MVDNGLEFRWFETGPSLFELVVLLPPPMPAESGAMDLFWSSGAGDGTWPFGAGEGTFELKELEELKLGLCQLYVWSKARRYIFLKIFFHSAG